MIEPRIPNIEARALALLVVQLCPRIIEDGDLADNFQGCFCTWDDVIKTASQAWPENSPQGYSESPLEIIARIIDERDELREALRRIAGMEADQHSTTSHSMRQVAIDVLGER